MDGTEIGAGTTDSEGNYSDTVIFPQDLPDGEVTLTVECGDQSVSAGVFISGTGFGESTTATTRPIITPTTATTLPVTGANTGLLLMVGGAMIALGGAFVVVTRRRRDYLS